MYVQPDLDTARTGPRAVKARQMLRHGPWCWPREPGASWESALRLAELDSPPAMRVGVVPLVSVGDGGSSASLWAFGAPATKGTPLTGSAAVAWSDVRAAVPGAMPVLWRSVSEAWGETPLVATWLGMLCLDGRPALQPGTLTGRSFGLSMALALVSKVSGCAVPAEVVASAALSAEGLVSGVDGLAHKVECICRVAPRLRRLLVAVSDVEAAQRAAGDRLEVVGVASLSQAVARVWPNGELTAALDVAKPEERREFVEALFTLALGERSAAVEWSPVAKAAHRMSAWALDEGYRWRVAFALAVAERHDRNAGKITLPPAAVLQSLRRPKRLACVAHLVQQAADAGTPSPREVSRLAREAARGRAEPSRQEADALPVLPERADWSREDARLAGALGRLESFSGNPTVGLQLQRDAAKFWIELEDYRQACYPLAEWLRLAGALGPGAATTYEEASDAVRICEAAVNAFVRAAQLGAAVRLDRVTSAQRRELEALVADAGEPAHVRASVLRWWTRLDPASATDRLEALRRGAAPGSLLLRSMQRADALIRLDRALSSLDDALAEDALADLREFDPAVLQHLEKAAGDEPVAAYVAWFYPY